MSDTEHAAVTEVPGAPAQPDEPVTVTAPWHNAPGTGAYAEPDVTTVVAYEKADEDGPLVAKVIEPPARPTPRGALQAETPAEASAEAPAKPKAARSKTGKPSAAAATEDA